MMYPKFLAALFLICLPTSLLLASADLPSFVGEEASRNAFPLVADGRAAAIWADKSEPAGVARAVGDLRDDIQKVTGVRPAAALDAESAGSRPVIVGTMGKSPRIEALRRSGKLDIDPIEGKWEAFHIEVVDNPMDGVEQALVIAGSDRRGVIFGIYELSSQIGVSPWYWWADAPIESKKALYVSADQGRQAWPQVKYRGIFLNDEAPALTGWVNERYGGYNHEFYAKVFELLLRLQANFLWPAMWDAAFNDDDPLNPKLADEYGIVMSTSHHEPMLRAHKEWQRYGEGEWNYATNPRELRDFWEYGVQRNRLYESIITLGMRGDGDKAMSEETNIELLETIVSDQRDILQGYFDRPLEEIPQVWTLYKEVQGYYDRGMRVPDDVTLLWSDDNWGHIRRLPRPDERDRSGGAGVYYHFDYVGGPRSYKWINSTPLSKIWEQMHLAWRFDANRIWVVNVGDLKPMEYPISFFLSYAWDPAAWPYERLDSFGDQWAASVFGEERSAEIGELLDTYSKYNGRRKPSLLSPETFSLIHYREADRVIEDWNRLASRAEAIAEQLPEAAQDAYFQLVLYPIQASRVVNELYVAAARNRLYGYQGRGSTNDWAERTQSLFEEDAEWARRYHEDIAGGKWNHFMAQNNIGWTYWNQPHRDTMPAVTRVQVPESAEIGVAIEGSRYAWPTHDITQAAPVLPELSPFGPESRWIEVFNRGRESFAFEVETSVPWLSVYPSSGQIRDANRLEVSVDWEKAPTGAATGHVILSGPSGTVSVAAPVFRPESPLPRSFTGFVESAGQIAIEATDYQRAVGKGDIEWMTLEDHGRLAGGVTPGPATASDQSLGKQTPRLEYDVYFFSKGPIEIDWQFAPSLDFQGGEGLRYAVSIDGKEPEIHRLNTSEVEGAEWNEAVANAVRTISTKHEIEQPGKHSLKFWMITPGVVLQRIIVDAGGLRPSYLGPPASELVSSR